MSRPIEEIKLQGHLAGLNMPTIKAALTVNLPGQLVRHEH